MGYSPRKCERLGSAASRSVGGDSIDAEKTKLGGQWSTNALVLGFDIDAEEETVEAPDPKAVGFRIYILIEELVVGSHSEGTPDIDWIHSALVRCPHLWASCVQPVDLLIGYGSVDSAQTN